MTEVAHRTAALQKKKRRKRRKRKLSRTRLNLWGRLTSFVVRPLPQFIIIGAQKAGTTSLYEYLCQHPQIMSAARKELHYFSDWYTLGMSWYRSQFPRKSRMNAKQSRLGAPVITGEASPTYLFNPHVAGRIAKHLPDVKLIAILRDPVSRAFSHYKHSVRHQAEEMSFEEAVRTEHERIGSKFEQLLTYPNYCSPALKHHSYLARGLYAQQLQRYLALFRPEQMLILISDDLFSDPQSAYSRTLKFLGVEDHRLADAEAHNVGKYDRTSIPMRAELEEYFKPHNRALYDLLGYELAWPASPASSDPAPVPAPAHGKGNGTLRPAPAPALQALHNGTR